MVSLFCFKSLEGFPCPQIRQGILTALDKCYPNSFSHLAAGPREIVSIIDAFYRCENQDFKREGDFCKDPQPILFRAEIQTQEAQLSEPMVLPTAPLCPELRYLLCWLRESFFKILQMNDFNFHRNMFLLRLLYFIYSKEILVPHL